MDRVSLVVFDVGGTIVEDRGEVPRALLAALSENGVEASPADIRQLRGASKREIISTLIGRQHAVSPSSTRELVDASYARFQECLEKAYRERGVKPIEGVHASLSWLRERKIAVAANTGFPRRIADLVLRQAGLESLIDAVVTGDDVAKGRPAPYLIFRAMERMGTRSVREVISVGDTPLDIQAGHNAGVSATVGVLTGVYSAADFLEHHPSSHVIPSVAALPPLLESLCPALADRQATG